MKSWAQLYDADILNEIQVGIVFHLDPERLLQEGGTHTVEEHARVQGQHFFLCIQVAGDLSQWVPLFTNGSAERIQLPSEGRYGHPKWCSGVFHFYREQVWSGTAQAIANAAARAHDKTRRGSRNGIDPARIPAAA